MLDLYPLTIVIRAISDLLKQGLNSTNLVQISVIMIKNLVKDAMKDALFHLDRLELYLCAGFNSILWLPKVI